MEKAKYGSVGTKNMLSQRVVDMKKIRDKKSFMKKFKIKKEKN